MLVYNYLTLKFATRVVSLMEICTLLSAILAVFLLKKQSPDGCRSPFSICIFDFFVTWSSFKPKFISAHRFSPKSDYLLRYSDSRIIFKADVVTAAVVAGPLIFKLWPV